jgi:hypothetical protein
MVAVTCKKFFLRCNHAVIMHLSLHSRKALDVYRDVLYIPGLILSRINEIKYILASSTLQHLYQTIYEVDRKCLSLARVSLLFKCSLTKDEVCTTNELKSPDKWHQSSPAEIRRMQSHYRTIIQNLIPYNLYPISKATGHQPRIRRPLHQNFRQRKPLDYATQFLSWNLSVVSPAIASTILAQIVTDLLFVVECGCILVALCRSQMMLGAGNGWTRSRRNIERKITVHFFQNIYFLWTWR